MSKTQLKISIIIVNYNVKDFLEQCLISVERALNKIPSEIIVVDNASLDGSVQMLQKRFPQNNLITNDKNLGFSAANNQALKIARGEFVVLLNPDTVVQEDTFSKLLEFFEKTPDASAATCKILNPDGTFSVDCRHSIPTPSTAFWKVTGLASIFPKSKIFGRYNLTYLDEDETYPVEAISGSFMMVKHDVVQKTGLLDEIFFMYCEDIDYCHRINQSGGKIYYVPDSQIIHYKGESTKKLDLDYIITFNKSLYLFYKKHYKQRHVYPFELLILLGVVLRGVIVFFKNLINQYYPFIIDMVILNLSLLLSFYIRLEFARGFSLESFFRKEIIINIFASGAYFLASLFFNNLNKNRFRIIQIIKAHFVTYTFLAALTFFLKQFAFSRLVVLLSAVISTIVMIAWRIGLRFYGRHYSKVLERDIIVKRALIAGYDDETINLLNMLKGRIDSGIEISGIISQEKENIGESLVGFPVVASLGQLPDYLDINKIDMVIFSTHNISYQRIFSTMSKTRNPLVEFKMVPGHLEFMIGKSTIERLDSVPLVDIEYAYRKPFNRFIKRSADLSLSMLILLITFPITLLALPFKWKSIGRKVIHSETKFRKNILWSEDGAYINFILNIFEVLRGNLSFVGACIEADRQTQLRFNYKPGLTGIVQLNRRNNMSDDNLDNIELQYLKKHDFLMDLEILLKSLLRK